MYGKPKSPGDPHPYSKSPDSRPLSSTTGAGRYVYVVDLDEVIHIAPDGDHMHPHVLGNARRALYEGEIYIDGPGSVEELTNASGTFRFGSQRSLCCVAENVRRLGFHVNDVLWFPRDGGMPALITCA